MAKFSVGIEEDGEGPSNRVPKRQRLLPIVIEEPEAEQDVDIEGLEEGEEEEEEEEEGEGEEEDDEEEEEEEEYEEEEEESEAEEAVMSSGVQRDPPPVCLTLTDPEVLDCPICCEPLTIPVFQCDNGHIACTTCCLKVRHKCPSCATPIGYNRCRAIEKVLESVKAFCQNRVYGCTEGFSYNMKQKHEKLCSFAPCSCPIADCNFQTSSKQLYKHFTDKHKCAATHFFYDKPVLINLRKEDKFKILQEERDGSLFILNNMAQTLGNVITLNRIGPSGERGYFYELNAKALNESCTLRWQSFTKSTPKLPADVPLSLGFFLVPSPFFPITGMIQMELRVWSYNHFPRNFQRAWALSL
ncbi:Seven-in-absentia protein, sina [Corchorus olitorius]|uniref:RING-type E3 ubiquitin transferase n=1 Tax=Corchorus olitorius TaxID=93759 RepID=A0A1R3HT60_9ROSI|nr:Seven-in-absentia protein, sina [Corchorus olitorius]